MHSAVRCVSGHGNGRTNGVYPGHRGPPKQRGPGGPGGLHGGPGGAGGRLPMGFNSGVE